MTNTSKVKIVESTNPFAGYGPYRPDRKAKNWVIFIAVVMVLGTTAMIHFLYQGKVAEENARLEQSTREQQAALDARLKCVGDRPEINADKDVTCFKGKRPTFTVLSH